LLLLLAIPPSAWLRVALRFNFFTVPMATSCCWLSGRPEGTARPGGGAGKQSQFQHALRIARRSVA